MLRTNLASRPFYNERLVHVLLGIGLALVLAFTAFNVMRLVGLSSRQAALAAAASADERRAADLNAKAAAIRRGIDPKEMARVTAAAAEANAIVDARAFSWTALFNDVEATLPPAVMLTSIRPSVDDKGVMQVTFVALGKSVEDLDTFIERLEETTHFARVLATSERLTDDGLYETVIVGIYEPAERPAGGDGAVEGAAEEGTR